MIDRNNEDSAWEEKGSAKRFPIESIRFQGIGPGIPIKTAPYPIANLIGNMESPELDALTTCTRSFDDIMASLFPDYQNRSPVW